MIVASSNYDLSGEDISHNLLVVLESLKPMSLDPETQFPQCFSFFLFLHVAKKLCSFGTRTHTEKAFELVQRFYFDFCFFAFVTNV